MATIYIHVGAPKTATSTIQSVFSENFNTLMKQRVLYPQEPRHGVAHHVLVCDLIEKHKRHAMPDFWYGPKQRGSSWSSLVEEIDGHRNNIDKVIISSELFLGQTRDMHAFLCDMRDRLSGHEIKIIIYLRRQDELYSSFYNQDVKGVRHWERSADEFYNTHQLFQMNYFQLLEMWAEAFGKDNILVRPFDVTQLKNGDVVEDFCEILDVEGISSGGVFENDGLGVNQLYVKRCLNRIGFEKDDNQEAVNVITQLLPESPAKNVLYVNRPTYTRYRQEWLRVNRIIEENYLHGGVLFSRELPLAKDLNLFEIDAILVESFLQKLVSHLKENPVTRLSPSLARLVYYVAIETNMLASIGKQDRSFLHDFFG